jgi:hypothetical protein
MDDSHMLLYDLSLLPTYGAAAIPAIKASTDPDDDDAPATDDANTGTSVDNDPNDDPKGPDGRESDDKSLSGAELSSDDLHDVPPGTSTP